MFRGYANFCDVIRYVINKSFHLVATANVAYVHVASRACYDQTVEWINIWVGTFYFFIPGHWINYGVFDRSSCETQSTPFLFALIVLEARVGMAVHLKMRGQASDVILAEFLVVFTGSGKRHETRRVNHSGVGACS